MSGRQRQFFLKHFLQTDFKCAIDCTYDSSIGNQQIPHSNGNGWQPIYKIAPLVMVMLFNLTSSDNLSKKGEICMFSFFNLEGSQ